MAINSGVNSASSRSVAPLWNAVGKLQLPVSDGRCELVSVQERRLHEVGFVEGFSRVKKGHSDDTSEEPSQTSSKIMFYHEHPPLLGYSQKQHPSKEDLSEARNSARVRSKIRLESLPLRGANHPNCSFG